MNPKAYKIGIVGATGAVGYEVLRLLLLRNFPLGELRLMASSRSSGRDIEIENLRFRIQEVRPELFQGLDIVFFSAGSEISKRWVPEAMQAGALVIDKSSYFRQQDKVPLVIPEINPEDITKQTKLIATPNCTTTITLMGLYPLHRVFGLKRFWASTYQSVSGSGVAGIQELENQIKSYAQGQPIVSHYYSHPIAFNLIPQIDKVGPMGYTREEEKMREESKKILKQPHLQVSVTCVRVPVLRCHGISVQAEFEKTLNLEQARGVLRQFPGVEWMEDLEQQHYPTPELCAKSFSCGIGRLRKDSALENGLSFWIVGDQLWKGAALNAVQIAEYYRHAILE